MQRDLSRLGVGAVLPALLIVLGLAACDSGQREAAEETEEQSSTYKQGSAGEQSGHASAPDVAQLGAPAPDFVLTDLEGRSHRLSDYTGRGKAVVLEWFNPDCPFVRKHHEKTRSMAETAAWAEEHGVVWLAINSGAPGKQGHGQERNERAKKDYDIGYPILLDASGEVGHAYGAKTTPHMYVIAADGTLIYQGAIDDTPNPSELGQMNYVRRALEEHFSNQSVSVEETRPYGCTVKYAS
ncbi:MAG: redoxin domain-containing protein [Candidatus Eisenbacteria bacterium]|nr:redoxin domain-containing protein [Candidatus Eisenbacteria bacterium]